MANTQCKEVNLTKRVRTSKGLRYCPVVLSANGRVKPDLVIVDRQQQRHPEGASYLEWRENGRRVASLPRSCDAIYRKEDMHENKYPVVSHSRDPRFLTLRSLQTSQGRSRTGLYLIEGIRHVARAVEHHAPVESVFFDPSILSNQFGQKLARRLRQRRVPGVRLSSQLYRDLTLAAEPQGIGAVAAAMDSASRYPGGGKLPLARSRINRIAGKSGHDHPNRRGGGRKRNFRARFRV